VPCSNKFLVLLQIDQDKNDIKLSELFLTVEIGYRNEARGKLAVNICPAQVLMLLSTHSPSRKLAIINEALRPFHPAPSIQ
jgi:hypothetical protein